jgi:hypothetical protein
MYVTDVSSLMYHTRCRAGVVIQRYRMFIQNEKNGFRWRCEVDGGSYGIQ